MQTKTEKACEEKMNKTLENFKQQMTRLKTGKANIAILDNITADYYGKLTPLVEMATISTSDTKTIVISPWDASTIPIISAALVNANLGMAPQSEDKLIRLRVPELTEESRKMIVKEAHKKAEEARVALRMIRRDLLQQIKQEEKDKVVTEDDVKLFEKNIQKLTSSFNAQVESTLKNKESDLSKV